MGFGETSIDPGQALIRVEACGVCSSDVSMRAGLWRSEGDYPVIRGHEPVGIIEEIGSVMAAERGVRRGDRVAVDAFQRCGAGSYCLSDRGELCGPTDRPSRSYSMIPMSAAPGLRGEFSTDIVATSHTILYPVPSHVPASLATMLNPVGPA